MGITDIYKAAAAISEIGTRTYAPKNDLAGPQDKSEFAEILKKEVNADIHLSKHAAARIRSRTLPWNDDIQRRVGEGIEAAEKKGSREALILMDNLAVIANIKSRTVITAMDRDQLKGKIFTNIDSAVLV